VLVDIMCDLLSNNGYKRTRGGTMQSVLVGRYGKLVIGELAHLEQLGLAERIMVTNVSEPRWYACRFYVVNKRAA